MPQVSQPQILEFCLEQDRTDEIGAKLLARITYPKPEEQARRERLQDALCALALHHDARMYPEDRTDITICRSILRFTDQQLQKHLDFADKKLQERLISGRIAVAYLRFFNEGKIPQALGKIKRMSLNQVVTFVAELEGYKQPDNLEQRFWRPSKPVIHIAAALAVVAQTWIRRGEKPGFYHLLLHKDYLIDVIDRAMYFAELIQKDGQFPVHYDDLVIIQEHDRPQSSRA